MRLFRCAKPFKRDDLGPLNSGDRHDARAHGLARVMHCTRATLRQSATEVHATQAELLAKHVKQRCAGIAHFDDLGRTIYSEPDGRRHGSISIRIQDTEALCRANSQKFGKRSDFLIAKSSAGAAARIASRLSQGSRNHFGSGACLAKCPNANYDTLMP